MWLTAAFVVLLILFALTPEPKPTAAERSVDRTAEATPGPNEYVACSIDKTWDPNARKCVPFDATPLPCVEGTDFDKKAGFCLPTGTPAVVAPIATLAPGQFPGGFGDLPGINNHPDRSADGSVG